MTSPLAQKIELLVLVVGMFVTLLLFFFALGVHEGVKLGVSKIAKYAYNHFCMEDQFAEQVMSCYVGNQSKCLNDSVKEKIKAMGEGEKDE